MKDDDYSCNRVNNADDTANSALGTAAYKQDVSTLYSCALSGNTEAALYLALKYMEGKHVNRDMREAATWLAKAQDHPRAQYELGCLMLCGKGCKKDTAEAIDLLLSAAEKGYTPAKEKLDALKRDTDKMRAFCHENNSFTSNELFSYAGNYEYGIGTEEDETQAIKLYSLSADKGHAHACLRLGYLYENGRGTTPKSKKAYDMYSAAAEHGLSRAILGKAHCMETGFGTDADADGAISLYEEAAKHGSAAGKYHLARCFETGIAKSDYARTVYEEYLSDTIKSTEAEIKEYLKDAEKGDPLMCFMLAFLYECRHDEENAINAFEWYTYAAEGGYTPAYYRLGLCCENGKGVEKNMEKACANYALAADENYPPACFKLAVIRGIYDENTPELYQRAAYGGHVPSMCVLSLLYDLGCIPSGDSGAACKLFQQAKANGYRITEHHINTNYGILEYSAAEYLRALMKEARGTDEKTLADMYRTSADDGFTPALFRLAEIYAFSEDEEVKNPVLAYEMYAAAAENGYIQALYRLGQCFEKGIGVEKDLNAAFECYNTAASKNNAFAQFELGRFYEEGICCLQDKAEAFSLYRRAGKNGHAEARRKVEEHAKALKLLGIDIHAARRGDAVAEYNIAVAYETGTGVGENRAEAYRRYMNSAKMGYPEAQYVIGLAYETGKDLPYDRKLAESWYKKAAKKGHVGAKTRLNDIEKEQTAFYCYKILTSQGRDESRKKLIKHLDCIKLSAERGRSWAQYTYAVCMLEGYGVKRSISKGFELLNAAAQKGQTEAMAELANFMYYGVDTEQSFEVAADLYRKAALKGNAQACFMMGRCYERGHGTEQNFYMAMEWYKKAVKSGFHEGNSCIGRLYEYGRGTERDLESAKKHYALAIRHNITSAKFKMAELMMRSDDADEQKKGFALCCEAADEGYVYARIKCGTCYLTGTFTEKNEDRAFSYLSRAASQKNPRAQYLTGVCRELGKGTSVDKNRAMLMYRNAAIADNAQAQFAYFLLCHGTDKDKATMDEMLMKAAENAEPHALSVLSKEMERNSLTLSLWEIDDNTLRNMLPLAEQNDSEALYYAGLCLEQGVGVPRDIVRAIAFYYKAVALGNAKAMYRLYVLHGTGSVISYDGEEAERLCRMAADKGLLQAQFVMANISENRNESIHYMKKSANNGYVATQVMLGDIYIKHEETEFGRKEALKWFSMAAERENSYAQFRIAQIYEMGIDGIKDRDLALYYYEKSATNGNAHAAQAHARILNEINEEQNNG